jgi:hypothetical protein
MRMALVVSCIAMAVPASAQKAPIQATQLPPLQQQWRQEGLSPVQQSPSSPGMPSPSPTPVPEAPAPAANVWVPAGAAKLQALDKVTAQNATLTIKVGQSATFGSLTITVKACRVRPRDQAADAAAFLDVTDGHPDSPGFDGWMLEAEPAASMMQNPVYDLRVVGCA